MRGGARLLASLLLGMAPLPVSAQSGPVPTVPVGEAAGDALESEPVESVAVGNATVGRSQIRALGCGVCHAIPGIPGAIGIVGPPLDGFGRRPLIAGSLPNRPEILVRFILDPPALVPATAMPRLPLDSQDARDIAAYLTTLR